MDWRTLYEKELEALKMELVSGYKTPAEEARILRRIELIEYKLA